MKKIALFYSVSTVKTAMIAKKIQESFGANIPTVDIEKAWKDDFMAYDNLIIGTSTWFDGELPTYWDEFLPELAEINMQGKKVAIFGLGDQTKYPDNFADGIGILADVFEKCGATLVGFTQPEDYTFHQSLALKDGKLQGLVIDFENQSGLTDTRVNAWVKQLKKEMNLSGKS